MFDAVKQRQRLWQYLGFILLALAVIYLISAYFYDRPYREDELWVVHSIVLWDPSLGWENALYHLSIEYPALNVWIILFGHHEHITRFMSTLITLLGLAFTYRLAADLFNRRVALASVFLLGLLPYFQFFTGEVRPYPVLPMSSAGLSLLLLRWLQSTGKTRRNLLIAYLLLYGFTIASHTIAVYIIASHALLVVILVRWDKSRARVMLPHVLMLFLIMGIASLPRVVTSLQYTNYAGGIAHALPPGLGYFEVLYDYLQTNPMWVGIALVLLALNATGQNHIVSSQVRNISFRFSSYWGKVYLILPVVTVIVTSFSMNYVLRHFTNRMIIIIVPALAILAAYGFYNFNRWLRVFIIIVLLLPLGTLREFDVAGPYREVAAWVQETYAPGAKVITDTLEYQGQIPFYYYLLERGKNPVSQSDLVAIGNESLFYEQTPFLQIVGAQRLVESSPQLVTQVESLTRDQNHVFLIYTGTNNAALLDLLDDSRTVVRSQRWSRNLYSVELVGPDLDDIYRINEDIRLRQWNLPSGVTVAACDDVSFESWWTIDAPLTDNYSMTLVLAGADGVGVTRNDGIIAETQTLQWETERLYRDVRSLTVPCDLPPGEYPLLLGWYDYDNPETALPMTTPDGGAIGNLGYLTTLVVQ